MEVDLTGAPETMSATLYARALDARAQHPVLGDTAALGAVSRIEYDFRRAGINASAAAGVAMRRPVVAAAEGLTTYLPEDEQHGRRVRGRRARLADHR
ncbi:hypothetical protein [Saccharothrix deserti]|uniref:hypothetical protein n=1 Tax=Saccharothrix deserti TaxID=2593674 RepID=UPI00131A6751|nr:hypothetical protein [Saccharothrix deserti]